MMSKLTGRTQRRRHRRSGQASAASFWLAPLILALGVVTVFAVVAINSGSTLSIIPAPAPTRHGASTGSSAAQGQQPGGTTFSTGRPGSESQWTQQPRKPITSQSPSPQPSQKQSQKQRQQQQQQPPTVTFAATAGPFCPHKSSTSTDAASSPAGIGWQTATAIKPTEDGCGNRFLFTLLAGHVGDFELLENHFDWSFRTGRAAPVCTLSFFVPFSEQANSDAVIWISNGSRKASYDPAYRIASFTINQADNRGRWFSVGPFAFPGGTVFAELTNTGDGPYYGTVVASAMRVTCSGLPKGETNLMRTLGKIAVVPTVASALIAGGVGAYATFAGHHTEGKALLVAGAGSISSGGIGSGTSAASPAIAVGAAGVHGICPVSPRATAPVTKRSLPGRRSHVGNRRRAGP